MGVLRYRKCPGLLLRGTMGGDSIQAIMQRIDRAQFKIHQRFRWVNSSQLRAITSVPELAVVNPERCTL